MTTLTSTWADPVARAQAHLARPDATPDQLRQDLAELLPLAVRAQRCPLTSLWTREAWTRQATQMVSTGRPAAVLFIDLDGFKGINDTLGHQAGDAILTAVAARLSTWCQGADGVPARLGGDEFVAIVPATSWLAIDLAVLRDELTAPVEYPGRTLRVGASIGAATVAPGPEDTAGGRLSAAMHEADLAMYRDKAARKGGPVADRRGRLVTADGTPAAGPDPVDDARTSGPVSTLAAERPAAGRLAEE